jgi:hypothetical protein
MKKNAFFSSNLGNISGTINLVQMRSNNNIKSGKKRVTFNLKTVIHEYEKQKEMSDESSDGEEERHD